MTRQRKSDDHKRLDRADAEGGSDQQNLPTGIREALRRVINEWAREAGSQTTAFNVPSVYLGSLVSDLIAEVPGLTDLGGGEKGRQTLPATGAATPVVETGSADALYPRVCDDGEGGA